MDTQTRYLKNLRNNPADLKRFDWINAVIDYDFNSHGFRCPKFTEDPTIMFLGCSFTIGIGLPYEDIWPTLISKKLKMRSANLGIGGSGPDTAFRMCLAYIDKINPKIVIHMINPGIRFELLDDYRIDLLTAMDSNNVKLYQRLFADENNYFFNLQKNTLAIKMLCSERNIKFLQIESKDYIKSSEPSLARDLVHEGRNEHKNAAEKILEKL